MVRPGPSLRTPWEERRVRAWWAALITVSVTTLSEVAYLFIDLRVHPGQTWLPLLRGAHAAEGLGLLGVLLARRREASSSLSSGLFLAALLPFLYVFAEAERAMAASGLTWQPMMGHKLAVLGIGVLAPGGFWLGATLVAAFSLESVLLWYGLGLGARLEQPWEPWVTLIHGLIACGMLGWRERAWHTEQRLWRARLETESMEQLAHFILALRDATNTPLQTLELGATLLRRRLPEGAPVLDSMERAVHRLRELSQRMSSADALLEWREGEESFDADAILRGLQQSLEREAERRRH